MIPFGLHLRRAPIAWSATDHDGTISPAGQSVSGGGGGDGLTFVMARSTPSMFLNQRYYNEWIVVATGGNGGIGYANTGAPNSYPGADTNGIGLYFGGSGNALVFYNGTNDPSVAMTAPVTGDRICTGIETLTGRFWARVNNRNWFDQASGQNPATGAGGIACSGIVSAGAPLCMAFTSNYPTGESVTMAVPTSSWLYAAPAGFISPNAVPNHW